MFGASFLVSTTNPGQANCLPYSMCSKTLVESMNECFSLQVLHILWYTASLPVQGAQVERSYKDWRWLKIPCPSLCFPHLQHEHTPFHTPSYVISLWPLELSQGWTLVMLFRNVWTLMRWASNWPWLHPKENQVDQENRFPLCPCSRTLNFQSTFYFYPELLQVWFHFNTHVL